ncbi:MAG: T9SS type A sorting domain-containing protein [Terrimonas sp.]|nr:T9SS type A sorting domain-containing protein [Terrimonas sp.]
MRKSHLVAGITILSVFTSLLFFTKHISKENNRYESEEHGEFEEEEERESGADKQLSMWFQARAYPDPTYLTDKYQRAWAQHQQLKNNALTRNERVNAANWATLGPVGSIGGRILCIAIDPNNSNNLWAGSASGGIWKSTDAGANWSSVTTNLNVLGVSTIIIDPSNSNVIYAGTGEVLRSGNSNIGFNVWKARGTYGIGIIKSTNGGTTWSQVMTKSTSDLFGIQNLTFDPSNSNTIYACATDGVYRSTNNGSSWSQILSQTYCRDIAIDNTNTNRIAVSYGNMTDAQKGVKYTTNGNNATPTWNNATGFPAFEGYIQLDNVGTTLFASVGISSSTANTNREIYQSANFGASWTVVGGTSSGSTTNHCSYQFWFAHTVAINPFATDSIMFGGVNLYRYRVSNITKTTVGGPHADQHDIKFDPNIRGRVYVCNDGGIYKSTNGGSSFTKINNGLDAVQFYASLGVSSTNANRIIGGLQDNGQVLYNGSSWTSVSWGGGDGTACAIDPSNDNNILASRDAKQVFRSTNGGSTGGSVTSYWGFVADSRTAFVAPLAFSKSSPTTVYLASDNLHKSTNSGASFSNDAYGSATNYIEAQHKTAIALAVSPTNANKVYVSTSPFAQYDNDVNNLYVTGQPNFLRTTTGGTPFTSIKGSLPDRFVMDIAISENNDDSVYVVLGGFGTAHVYVTPNGGTTWTAIGTGLPDVPFNAILIDPVNPSIIYAGCDFGVYVSPDRGATWTDYSNGLTDATLIMDLQVDANNKLIAATHGRGIYRSDLYSGTLPVTLTSFSGYHQSGVNKLQWTTENERNLRAYELEKSLDGTHFTTATIITPRNQQGTYSYAYTDPVNTNATAVYYYRLKSVDLDGAFTYSRIVALQVNGKKIFNVLNNPFGDQVTIGMNLPAAEKITVSLYDSKGSLVRKESFAGAAGPNTFIIDNVSALSKGTYIVEAILNNQKFTQQVLKK